MSATITAAEWTKEISRVGANVPPIKFDSPKGGGGYVKLRGYSWHVHFWRDGREISRVLKGAKTREQAREMADRLIAEWDAGKKAPRTDIGGHPSFDKAFDEQCVLKGRIYLLNKWWNFTLTPRSNRSGRSE